MNSFWCWIVLTLRLEAYGVLIVKERERQVDRVEESRW